MVNNSIEFNVDSDVKTTFFSADGMGKFKLAINQGIDILLMLLLGI